MKDKLFSLWSRPFVRKGLIALVVFYLILGITGYFVAPSYVKNSLLERLSDECDREVSIEKVSINPYVLAIDVGLSGRGRCMRIL